jgi:hypothetical protein
LEKADVKNFDDWVSAFAEVTKKAEPSATGGYRIRK